MYLGENKNYNPSKKKWKQQPWFWPAIYGSIALVMIAGIFTYNEFILQSDETDSTDQVAINDELTDDEELIPVSRQPETMKYPLKEDKLGNAQIVQEFYDVNATAEMQQNALLVFNQIFQTSEGISIVVGTDSFEVLAAMTGEVKEVKLDPFIGNRIVIAHAGGYETIYQSVGDILVKEGDIVMQGEQIGTSMENESNPMAGNHLHFKVRKDGQLINPRSLLAF